MIIPERHIFSVIQIMEGMGIVCGGVTKTKQKSLHVYTPPGVIFI